MSKTTYTLIPELRFPEFVNDEEWKEKAFEELFLIGNGKDYKHLSIGDIPVYGSGGYMLSVNDYLYDGKSVCIGRKGTIDKPLFLSGKFWTVDTLFYTHSFKDCTPKFIYYIFQSINWLKHNEAGGVPSLSKTNIYKIEVSVPNPQEQQKIAFCLSSLDELITAYNDKLEALKDHKKGLMQNLFPQEGETVPKYRFSEFEDDGEWVEKTLLDLALNGFSNGVFNDPKKVGYGYKLINVSDMYIETTIDETRLSKVGISESEFNKNKVEFGDIFFTRSSLVASGIAKSNIYLGNSNDVTFDGHLIRLRPKKEIVVPKFLYYLSQTNNTRNQMVARGKTATMTTIGQSDIASVHAQLPSRLSEQQKLSDCLSSLDEIITAHAEKIEQLKRHKKGLMQGLFPQKVKSK